MKLYNVLKFCLKADEDVKSEEKPQTGARRDVRRWSAVGVECTQAHTPANQGSVTFTQNPRMSLSKTHPALLGSVH